MSKHQLHKQYGSDIVSVVSLFSPTAVMLLVADALAVKEVTTNRVDFAKPVKMYKIVSIFGPNIVASEFDEWKRHRRIAAPSFSEKNNRLVYEETTRIVAELFQFWSENGNGRVVKVENAVDLTSNLALMVISSAGFGSRLGWNDGDEAPAGHVMTFQKSLNLALSKMVYRLLLGDSVLRLWEDGRETMLAFKEFRVYMSEMIEERQNAPGDGSRRADLFTNLINGTSLDTEEKEDNQLLKDELMGNIFIFLLAGHETTAHSLGFTLALLAVHQDIQEKAFLELRSMVPQGEIPTYGHIVRWTYGLAIMYETLRMYPPALGFPKYAVNDTVITTSSTDGKNTSINIPVPAGTNLMINIAGLHYNPKYWDKPEQFRPERFMGDYNRDAFMPFAGGPRACVGRRFSEIEAVTFLANLILKYKFIATLKDKRETPVEMKERLLRWSHGSFTLHPVKVPLTFMIRDD